MSAGETNPYREVTVVVILSELWHAHTALFETRSQEFPHGHGGGAICTCSIARALRVAEGWPEPEPRQSAESRS